jgi:hypothetical protein
MAKEARSKLLREVSDMSAPAVTKYPTVSGHSFLFRCFASLILPPLRSPHFLVLFLVLCWMARQDTSGDAFTMSLEPEEFFLKFQL